MSLVLCSACARHVRSEDVVCPFCGAPLIAAGPALGGVDDGRYAAPMYGGPPAFFGMGRAGCAVAALLVLQAAGVLAWLLLR